MSRGLVSVLFVTVMGALSIFAAAAGAWQAKPPAVPAGWQLPPDADDTNNPLTVDAKLLASGRALFADKCRKCHGPGGRGDGPDADPDARERMDLTNPKLAARNSDGIVFYKVWNGRRQPKMPAFKDELTTEQAWAVVAYVQTLRK